MTRLRPRAEKAESLFVENLKRFSTASVIFDVAGSDDFRTPSIADIWSVPAASPESNARPGKLWAGHSQSVEHPARCERPLPADRAAVAPALLQPDHVDRHFEVL